MTAAKAQTGRRGDVTYKPVASPLRLVVSCMTDEPTASLLEAVPPAELRVLIGITWSDCGCGPRQPRGGSFSAPVGERATTLGGSTHFLLRHAYAIRSMPFFHAVAHGEQGRAVLDGRSGRLVQKTFPFTSDDPMAEAVEAPGARPVGKSVPSQRVWGSAAPQGPIVLPRLPAVHLFSLEPLLALSRHDLVPWRCLVGMKRVARSSVATDGGQS